MDSLTPWLDQLDISDRHYKLLGPETGKDFELKFTGAPSLGARRAKKANQLLLDPDTKVWKRLSTMDPENKSVQIFISPDESPGARREKQLTKRLLKSFAHIHSDKQFYYNRHLRAVCHDKKSTRQSGG